MRDSFEEFRKRGVVIVAVSVDPPDITREHAAKMNYPFIFLADEKAEVIKAWDFLHEGGFRCADISRPAEFLIDTSGTIRWRYISITYRTPDRLKVEEALKVIDEIKCAGQ